MERVFAGQLPALPTRFATTFPEIAARVSRWRRLSAERHALARLDARLLRDIGIDAAAAEAEAARPFWDAPTGR